MSTPIPDLSAADDRFSDPVLRSAFDQLITLLSQTKGKAWRTHFRKAIREINRLMTLAGWDFVRSYPDRFNRENGFTAPVFVVSAPVSIAICVDHKRPHAKSVLLLSRSSAMLKVIVLAGTSWYDYALDRRYARLPSVEALYNIHALVCVDPAVSVQTMDTVKRRAYVELDYERYTPEVLDLVTAAWDSGLPLNWRADVEPERHFERVLFERYGWHPDAIRSFWHRIVTKGLVVKCRNKTFGYTGLKAVAAAPASDFCQAH